MQSHDYVPGVSGWKIDENGRLELNDGNRRVIAKMLMVTTAGPGMTNDQAQASITESIREEVSARSHADESVATQIGALQCNVGIDAPFAINGDQVILSQAIVDAGKLSPVWGVRMKDSVAGQCVVAGVGLGLDCMCEGGYTGTPGDKEEKPSVEIDFKTGTVKLGVSPDSVAAKIEHEVKTRASADAQLSARIGSVEARVVQGLGGADQVRDVIRKELLPGGILHRK